MQLGRRGWLWRFFDGKDWISVNARQHSLRIQDFKEGKQADC
jgi:hypothetical protein